jgi:S-adenosylmethionine synthetase
VKRVIAGVIPPVLLRETVYHINPTGSFEIGGPDGDAGLTGPQDHRRHLWRRAPHGGGAFSGKDPTKVDRSAAYITRYLAKNIVAAGLATPLHDPARLCHRRVEAAVALCRYARHRHGRVTTRSKPRSCNCQAGRPDPAGIRTHLGLNKPIYRKTAAYGHFGRTGRMATSFPGNAPIWSSSRMPVELKTGEYLAHRRAGRHKLRE